MTKSRIITTPTRPIRPYSAHASLAGGNGSPVQETHAERLAHIEAILEKLQQTLDVQFQRMADMQVLIDRLTSK